MPDNKFTHIACRKDNGVLIVLLLDEKLQGDELADGLRQDFIEALSIHGLNKLIIDFRNVKYLSTAGFRPLLTLHRKLHELQGRMVFCNLSPETEEVFVVTRLISPNRYSTAPFERAEDIPSALARFRHHASRIEEGILVITLTESKLQGDQLADTLNDALLATVVSANVNKVILDMGPVELITTACLRPLLNLRKHLHAKGGRLILCNLHPLVSEVLTVTRLTSTTGTGQVPLESAKDVAAAQAALKS
jgi:anti-anti-sigma factor